MAAYPCHFFSRSCRQIHSDSIISQSESKKSLKSRRISLQTSIRGDTFRSNSLGELIELPRSQIYPSHIFWGDSLVEIVHPIPRTAVRMLFVITRHFFEAFSLRSNHPIEMDQISLISRLLPARGHKAR